MRRPSRLFAGAACLAALTLPACATDPYGNGGYAAEPDQIVLYEGDGYSGKSLPVNGPVPDLVAYRFNDMVSSIRLNRGSWEVCSDADFRGHCEVITTSESSLRTIRLNDNITSVRPTGAGYPPVAGGPGYGDPAYGAVVFYSDTGLRGDSLPVNRDEPELARAGFNDRARSVDIRSGVWELCTDADFRGRCETVDRSVTNLADIGLSGNLSSARLVADRPYRSY